MKPRLHIAALAAGSLLLGLAPNQASAQLVPNEALGLRVTRGFRVTLFADSDLANDIFAMTLDSRGQVVVTGPGYIRTLHDANNDGVAESATLFATTATGGVGLCFDGNDLYFTGDGALSRFVDQNGDGQADGPPERLLPLAFSEHGGHAMRKGPDGSWYLIGGNDTGFSRNHVTLPNSPIREAEAGALLRLTPDARSAEIVAHGFRNPYDFDFNWLGDLFTYDSDVESDFFLPWYTPTRIYHIGHGGHHGWRLTGWQRSWNRPAYYEDTVEILAAIGRGSPTGVTCYRHYQFPERYRNGIFALDWVFGRVLFLPLRSDGASYVTEPEVFLEPIGTHGFAPTDVAVAPDGSLLISIGGRKTRGGVYRVQFVAQPNAILDPYFTKPPTDPLEVVLRAPQPLDAWSRAVWMPLARNLGPEPFSRMVVNELLPVPFRIRAIEVLTEMFGGLAVDEARLASRSASVPVRARVAWSLGRVPCENFVAILLPMTDDPHPLVRRCALEAVADRLQQMESAASLPAVAVNLGHPDKRVRQAAAHLASLLPEPSWNSLWTNLAKAEPPARLTAGLASVWRNPGIDIHSNALSVALTALTSARDADVRLHAVRLAMLALGDWHLNDPSLEAYTAYELPRPLAGRELTVAAILSRVRPLFPSGATTLDAEMARLLAMLEDVDVGSVRKVVAKFTPQSAPILDFHYLVVLSRLRALLPAELVPKVADAVLGLARKLDGQEQRGKQNWTVRLTEVVNELVNRNPPLADVLLLHPSFATPAHLSLVAAMDEEHQLQAARLYFLAAQSSTNFVWSGLLVDLLWTLPAEHVRPVLRQQWSNPGLRDDLALKLAEKPEVIDRDKFLVGLGSPQPHVVRVCLSALLKLPRDESPERLLPVFRLLRRLLADPMEAALRAEVVSLLKRQTGQPFQVQETGTDAASLKKTYQPYFDWFALRYPALARIMNADAGDDPARWANLLKYAPWTRGEAARGAAIFQARACATCHTGSTQIGPDLAGVAARYSMDDLFNAILYPSRDVAPPYRTTGFQTRDGQSHIGIVLFESADGVILQTGATTTVRLSERDIVSRQPSEVSLMPTGLLNGMQSQDLADLYVYLKTLQPRGR